MYQLSKLDLENHNFKQSRHGPGRASSNFIPGALKNSTSVSSCDQDLQRRWATCSTVRMHNIIWMSMPPKMGYEQLPPNYFLRVIPNLKHYSDTISAIVWKYSDVLSDILSVIYFDILSGTHFDILSGMCSGIAHGILSDILSGVWLRSGNAHWDLESTVGVQQCPLRSGARGWGPVVPTKIWRSPLRPPNPHRDLELAVAVDVLVVPTALELGVEVRSAHSNLEFAVDRRCPLRSGRKGKEEGGKEL